ncbi:hypothetical protein VPH35_059588 [Triticum aestivum]|uniref:Uncharacterized protein n=1 Tax=Aegilops tauschii subsp. strangulata TaxID=200361 RepID=A0A453EUC9_AEGTS
MSLMPLLFLVAPHPIFQVRHQFFSLMSVTGIFSFAESYNFCVCMHKYTRPFFYIHMISKHVLLYIFFFAWYKMYCKRCSLFFALFKYTLSSVFFLCLNVT